MVDQKIVTSNIFDEYRTVLEKEAISRIFLVCGKTVKNVEYVNKYVQDDCIAYIFDEFSSNPTYENVVDAVSHYKESNCDSIMAIGGGSAIDVAKCIKAFANLDASYNYLEQEIVKNDVLLLVMPTTAGTGSESTSFAVIYFEGEKKSVDNSSLIPNVVFLDSKLLISLPLYQKKSTLLDALCHCVESFWSVNSNLESKEYSKKGLKLILENYKDYLLGSEDAARKMLLAANYAGKAINISKTTAAHAMCYKITKLYGLSHGHSAALCLSWVWSHTWNKANLESNNNLIKTLNKLAKNFGCSDTKQSIDKYQKILFELDISFEGTVKQTDIKELVSSINIHRIKNHPIEFNKDDLKNMYEKIIEKSDKSCV